MARHGTCHGQRTPPCHFNSPVPPPPFASAGKEKKIYGSLLFFFAGFQKEKKRDAQSLLLTLPHDRQRAVGGCVSKCRWFMHCIIATTGTHPGAMSSACISRARPSHTDADTDNTPMDTTCVAQAWSVVCRWPRVGVYSLLRKTSRLTPRVTERLPPPTLLARAILSTLAAAAAAPTPYGPWPSPPLPPDDPAA